MMCVMRACLILALLLGDVIVMGVASAFVLMALVAAMEKIDELRRWRK